MTAFFLCVVWSGHAHANNTNKSHWTWTYLFLLRSHSQWEKKKTIHFHALTFVWLSACRRHRSSRTRDFVRHCSLIATKNHHDASGCLTLRADDYDALLLLSALSEPTLPPDFSCVTWHIIYFLRLGYSWKENNTFAFWRRLLPPQWRTSSWAATEVHPAKPPAAERPMGRLLGYLVYLSG